MASTEQTSKSTQPAARPVLRTTLPSRSDFTPEAFLGQRSQTVWRSATRPMADELRFELAAAANEHQEEVALGRGLRA